MSIIISVIIPVYNAQVFLFKCLDSVVDQISEEIEIIVINDGSIDESSQIAQKYAQKYDSIKVIHQSNQGVFAARNNGLVHARGEYLIFLDADDYLVKGSIEYLISLLNKRRYDIIFFNIKLIGKKFLKTKPYLPKYSIGSNISKVMFLDSKAIAGYMGGKLIKTSIARQALYTVEYKYSRVELYEDCLFLFCVSLYCRTALTIDKEMYVYRIHESSMTQRKIPPQQIIDKLKVSKSYFENLEELTVVKSDKNNSVALRRIQRVIDSSILIQTAKKNNYIRNIYKAWLLDNRVVNLARIIVYLLTFGIIKK